MYEHGLRPKFRMCGTDHHCGSNHQVFNNHGQTVTNTITIPNGNSANRSSDTQCANTSNNGNYCGNNGQVININGGTFTNTITITNANYITRTCDTTCDCPSGWTKGVYNECLLIPDKTSNGTNYTTALKTCAQKYNAKLISIKNAAKHNFITHWFKNQTFDAYFWLDATRVLKADSSDSFIWSNGDRLTYTNWDSGLGGVEPNGVGLEVTNL
ncbi:unnamed protein product [Oppiella nova]|uniref:C-type lectin domain-containing protein n=1 Tax=Oppiella nova TaxID=334625 RepID=A0A7R9LZ77_9ACAR|nr:unnamed protein product [Oppiella nova]CAG2168427.1 unnamed protein product [Oppiella nova]